MTAPLTPERLAEIRQRDREAASRLFHSKMTQTERDHLRSDMDRRDLLAEVDRLRAANSDLEQYVRTYCPTPFEKAEVDRLRAENDRLRERPLERNQRERLEAAEAEVDRLRAQVAAVDHRCPSDHWPGRSRQQCHHWRDHGGDHGNRHYAWTDETRIASTDESPSCQRCGSYSHTSCPVAPWETQ